MDGSEVSEIRIRAIAELHRIDRYIPYFKNFRMNNFKFDLKSNANQQTASVCPRVQSHIQSAAIVNKSGVH